MFSSGLPREHSSRRVRRAQEQQNKLITGDYDVFGDGLVTLIFTPTYTRPSEFTAEPPAEDTEILTGDLFISLESARSTRCLKARNRRPASRAKIEALVQKTGAQLWIQHDMIETASSRNPRNIMNALYLFHLLIAGTDRGCAGLLEASSTDWLVGGDWGNTRFSTLKPHQPWNVKTLKGADGSPAVRIRRILATRHARGQRRYAGGHHRRAGNALNAKTGDLIWEYRTPTDLEDRR